MNIRLKYLRLIILVPISFYVVHKLNELHPTYPYLDEEVQKEYVYLLRSAKISGVVDSIFRYIDSNPRGMFNIRLKNGLKFQASVGEYPSEKYVLKGEKKSIYDFLQKGDSVYKPKDEDSLIVFKNDRKYTCFIPTKESHDSIFLPKKKTK